MNTVRAALLLGSFLTAAACGSHNHAPVVYGTDPARQTRVYHSPNEIKRERQAAQVAQAPVYRQPEFKVHPAGSVEPVQLTPVSAIYLDEPERAQRSAAAPARNDPSILPIFGLAIAECGRVGTLPCLQFTMVCETRSVGISSCSSRRSRISCMMEPLWNGSDLHHRCSVFGGARKFGPIGLRQSRVPKVRAGLRQYVSAALWSAGTMTFI